AVTGSPLRNRLTFSAGACEPTVSAGGASSPEGLGTAFSAASVQPGSEEPLGDNVGVREQPATSSNNPIHKRIMTSPRWSERGSQSRFDCGTRKSRIQRQQGQRECRTEQRPRRRAERDG